MLTNIAFCKVKGGKEKQRNIAVQNEGTFVHNNLTKEGYSKTFLQVYISRWLVGDEILR